MFHVIWEKIDGEFRAGDIDINAVYELYISFPFLLSFTTDQQNRKWLLWCYNDYVIIIVRIIKCFNDYFLMYDNSKVIGFIFALKTISNYFFQDFVLAIFENDNVHSQIIMIIIIIISVTGEFFLFLHVRYFSCRWLFL